MTDAKGRSLARKQTPKERRCGAKIEKLYESGVPLFTKDSISRLAEQLKEQNIQIELSGLDGKVIKVNVHPEGTLVQGEEDEWVDDEVEAEEIEMIL